jgi:hypothetical protein
MSQLIHQELAKEVNQLRHPHNAPHEEKKKFIEVVVNSRNLIKILMISVV